MSDDAEFTFTMRYSNGEQIGFDSPDTCWEKKATKRRPRIDTEAKAIKSAINSTLAYANVAAVDIGKGGELWASVHADGDEAVNIEFESTEWVR